MNFKKQDGSQRAGRVWVLHIHTKLTFSVRHFYPHGKTRRLTVTGKGERLSEVLTDDRHLHTDPQALMELFVADGGRPHKAGIL